MDKIKKAIVLGRRNTRINCISEDDDLLRDAKDSLDRSRREREYLQRVKENVREGDDIYERAYNKVTAYASETEYKFRKHTE